MNKFKLIAAVVSIIALAGCSRVISIPQVNYGIVVDGSDGFVDYDKLYRNENMLLAKTFCWNHCDKGYVFHLGTESFPYNASYSMPKSNKLELAINSDLLIEFNRDGGKTKIVERLKYISANFRPLIVGDSRENQVYYWNIKELVAYIFPTSKYQSILRKELFEFNITDAYDDLSSAGTIKDKVIEEINKELLLAGDLFKLKRLEFSTLSLPDEVVSKNTQEYNIDAQERIQKRQISMQRARVKERHLLNLEELQNDVELIKLIGPALSKEVLVYKWQQFANNSVENGIPVAIDPSMLNPTVSKMAGKAFDYSVFEETVKRRKSEVLNQIAMEQKCSESKDGCDNK